MSPRRTREMVTRLWRLVEIVHARRRGITAAAIVEALGASRATVYRDLKLLEEAGVALFTETVNGEVRYSVDREPLPALRPSAMQLAALLLARQALEPLDGTALVRELDGLIATRTGSAAESAITRAPRPRTVKLTVETVDRAIRNRRQLRIKYRAARSGTAWRVVDPAGLRLVDEHLYLIAWDPSRGDWRTFKLARILFAAECDEPAHPHPDFDPARLFAGAVKIWSADPVAVAVRVAASVAWLVPEWPLHESQTVDEQADGSVVVRARVAGILEAMRWSLRWGGNAEALEPSELRQAVAAELTSALARYGPTTRRSRAVSRKLRTGGAKL